MGKNLKGFILIYNWMEYYLKEAKESMYRCNGRRDITELQLKTPSNQSIIITRYKKHDCLESLQYMKYYLS